MQEKKNVIDTVKRRLDFEKSVRNIRLEEELRIAIEQSNNRDVRPHAVVWTEIRSQYKI